MDEAILSEARQILAEKRARSNAQDPSSLSYHERSEERQNKLFKKYCEHIETLQLVVGKPSVRKVRSGRWMFEKDRLFVIPTVQIQSSVQKTSVQNVQIFNRFYVWGPSSHQQREVIPGAGFDFSEPYLDADGNECGTTTISFYGELIPLIHRVFGEKLDELHNQLQSVDNDIRSRLTEIVEEHKKRVSKKESKKFQEKFFRFLKNTKSFSETDPAFLLACFRIDPIDFENLQEFLRINKADLNFISEEDILEAQHLAQVGQVIDS